MSNDEPTKEELAQRVDQLEATVQKMLPDRRQALKALAVGGTGAGLGAALSASAAGQQFGSATGQVGTDSEPLKEVIAQTGTFESVSTERIGSTRHYAGAFDGADADARLTNALSATSAGDTIYLEKAPYTSNRTISTGLEIVAQGGTYNGTELDAVWTLTARCRIRGISNASSSSEIIVDSGADASVITLCEFNGSTAITINDNNVRYVNNSLGDVTFASGTNGGLVDACRGTAYTDNSGSNTQGDIS